MSTITQTTLDVTATALLKVLTDAVEAYRTAENREQAGDARRTINQVHSAVRMIRANVAKVNVVA